MILNTDAGGTHKGSSVIPLFSNVSRPYLSLADLARFYWLHWTKPIDREGNSRETVAPADERKEGDEKKWRRWWLLTQFSALLLVSVWKSVRNLDGDVDSPCWGLWSVSLCQGVENHHLCLRCTRTLSSFWSQVSQWGKAATHLTTEPESLSTAPDLTSPFDYSALTWSWGHQRKEGEITCSCANLGLHLLGLGLLYPAATHVQSPWSSYAILCSPRCVIPYRFCPCCSDCQCEVQMWNLEAEVSLCGLFPV